MSHQIDQDISSALEHLRVEYDAIRTGRANPALVESINVEAYNSVMPLLQLASISAPEPRLLVIQPWDASTIKDIERALSQSSLGINPVVDGKLIRLPFPVMTEERRKQLSKVVHEKAEEIRIRVRTAREEAMKIVKRQQADSDISEDEAEIVKKKVQESVDTAMKEITALAEKKESEIMTV